MIFLFLVFYFFIIELSYLKNEVRVVFFGKIGSGKSFIGNIIFNKDVFVLVFYGVFVMFKCISKKVSIFGWDIFVVDMLGLFDIDFDNDKILEEIVKCIGIILLGLYCFLFVVGFLWFINEER